ncbi:hypothetical protein [Occallatibacter riparius]|uniref:Uncharacterized protein n=1 Tax=Occallatibacter riparius TaxID=1002689 RepID=A0A9J7BSB0_9BACT|nr:hypothetical protein [Occallatibacter riparius]UWZ84650.1 hypothetical protein MOP44_01645 [Occallatibacter riparius]
MAYAGSKARAGRNIIVSVGETPTVIGDVFDYGTFGGEWATTKVTRLTSSADEFIKTIKDNGNLQLKLNAVPSDAGQIALEAAEADADPTKITVQFPVLDGQTTTGNSFVFYGLVLGFKYSGDPSKQLQVEVNIKITGDVTKTPGA